MSHMYIHAWRADGGANPDSGYLTPGHVMEGGGAGLKAGQLILIPSGVLDLFDHTLNR